MPGLIGPAGMRGQARRVSRRTSRRTSRRMGMVQDDQPMNEQSSYNEPAESEDITTQLQKLGQLHESGVLTDEEFTSKKAELLSRM